MNYMPELKNKVIVFIGENRKELFDESLSIINSPDKPSYYSFPEDGLSQKQQKKYIENNYSNIFNGNTIVIHTQSEMILNMLRLYIKRNSLANTLFIIFFSEDNDTKCLIRVDKDGNLTDYPNDLFNDQIDVLTELIDWK